MKHRSWPARCTAPSTGQKNFALKKMNYRGTLRYMLPWMTAELDDIDAVFGGDPCPMASRGEIARR